MRFSPTLTTLRTGLKTHLILHISEVSSVLPLLISSWANSTNLYTSHECPCTKYINLWLRNGWMSKKSTFLSSFLKVSWANLQTLWAKITTYELRGSTEPHSHELFVFVYCIILYFLFFMYLFQAPWALFSWRIVYRCYINFHYYYYGGFHWNMYTICDNCLMKSTISREIYLCQNKRHSTGYIMLFVKLTRFLWFHASSLFYTISMDYIFISHHEQGSLINRHFQVSLIKYKIVPYTFHSQVLFLSHPQDTYPFRVWEL